MSGPLVALLCAVCLAAMGAFGWQRRELRGAWPFAVFNFALAAFALLTGLRAWHGMPDGVLAWLVPLRSMIGAAAPVPLVLFVLESIGQEPLARRLRPASYAWPALHALLMTGAMLEEGGLPAVVDPLSTGGSGHPRLDVLNAGMSTLLVVVAVLLLLQHLVRQRGHERDKAAWLLLAMLVGALGPLLDRVVMHVSIGVVTPLTLLLECVLFGYAFHRFGVLGALPVAYAQVFREIEAGIVLTGDDGRVIEANERAIHWLALQRGKIRGRVLATLGEPAARVAAVAPGERAVVPSWLVGGQQNAFEVACVPARSPYGLLSGRLHLLGNVTARRRAEQQVEQNTRELDALVEEQTAELARMAADLADGNRELARTTRLLAEAQRLARIGSWTWDRDGGGIRGSPELQMLVGRDRIVADFGLEDFVACLHPDDAPVVRGAAARFGTPQQRADPLLVRAVRPDGTLRWLRMSASRVLERDEAGRAKLALGTAQDVSEAVELEQRLERRGEELERRVQARSAELLALSRDQDAVNRLAVEALAPALGRIESLLDEVRSREPSVPTELDAALRRIGSAVARMRTVAFEARSLADAAARQLRSP